MHSFGEFGVLPVNHSTPGEPQGHQLATHVGSSIMWMVPSACARETQDPWASLAAQLVKNPTCNAGDPLQHRRCGFDPWVRQIP